MVDDLLSTRIGYATQKALHSYTQDFEKKAQEERKLYIDVVKKSVKNIIKDESTITESLNNVVLVKTLSTTTTYEAQASLTEFELNKILIDKLEKSKSYRAAEEHKNLYDALIKSYQLDKDLFDRMCAQAEELVFETTDTEMPQDQGDDMGNTKDQPNVKTTSKHDWIEDMVRTLWSPMKVTYDNMPFGKLALVTHVKVMKKYDYRYLEEIEVRRDDNTLYKFKEGDFRNLNLRDIEDKMLLSLFCDGTLTFVRRVLHDIANNLRMDYLPKTRWSNLDRKRSRIMIKAIDQQLFERRLIRNLEKFVGGRVYGNDFRLLEWTI
ncbi:hypothetical protein Tco_1288585 [Tanacetum coccineum]